MVLYFVLSTARVGQGDDAALLLARFTVDRLAMHVRGVDQTDIRLRTRLRSISLEEPGVTAPPTHACLHARQGRLPLMPEDPVDLDGEAD
jgi:hypothetical protein